VKEDLAMVSWDQFERAAPELAAAGRRLLTGPGVGDPFLATVRGSGQSLS
jgi:hypothetical protein